MLRIGFNGTKVAETTNAETNPNGEDVNKGWHQIVKEWKDGQQIITDAVVLDGDGKGDYVSLDAMASDLINTKIPAQYRNDPRLVVLVGADLVAAESFRLYQKADKPTEKIAAQLLSDSIMRSHGLRTAVYAGQTHDCYDTAKPAHLHPARHAPAQGGVCGRPQAV